MIRNTVEFEIDGKKIGFRTGNMSLAVAIKESGCVSVDELIIRLQLKDLLAANAFFYGCAYQYFQWKGLPIDFNMTHVSEWIEDLGLEKVEGLTDKLLESYKEKKNPEQPMKSEEIQPQ